MAKRMTILGHQNQFNFTKAMNIARIKATCKEQTVYLSGLLSLSTWIEHGQILGTAGFMFTVLGAVSRFHRYELPYVWRTWMIGLITILSFHLIYDGFNGLVSYLLLWNIGIIVSKCIKDAVSLSERQYHKELSKKNGISS